MASFNLTDKAWIPVINSDGTNSRFSLLELFEKAHKIREIYCDSPLETISLNRFLQALLIRIYQVNDEDTWLDIWNAGKFDIEPAKDYFEKWYNRFDIFDKERPFYQSTTTLSKTHTAFSKLRHDKSSANNATLFDHTYDSQEFIVPMWRVPTLLIAAQSYSVGGGISKPFNFSGAPLIGGCTFWIKEEKLFKSMLINTDYENIAIDSKSLCSWEKNYPVKCISRVPENYLDYLTWQSRSIKLEYNNDTCFDDNGNMIFAENKAKMYFHQGDKIESEFADPLMAKRVSNDKILSIRFDPNKALWRHAEVLFQHEKVNGARPSRNISFVAANSLDLGYDITHKFQIEAYGLLNDQAKVVIIKKESLPFFPVLMKEEKENLITVFIEIAERQSKILYGALSSLGKYLLYPSKDENNNLSKDEKRDVNGFIKTLCVEKNYWASLENVFIKYVEVVSKTTFTTSAEFLKFKKDTSSEIFKVAKASFENATNNFDSSAKHLRAITIANRKLYPINFNGENDG